MIIKKKLLNIFTWIRDKKIVLNYFHLGQKIVGEILTELKRETRLPWDKLKLTSMFGRTNSIIRPKVFSRIKPGVSYY